MRGKPRTLSGRGAAGVRLAHFRGLFFGVFSLGLAAGLAACAAPLRTPRDARGEHVSLLTYNINFGGPRPHATLEAIIGAGVDVICLQETSPVWEAFLRPRLSETYSHALFRHSGGAGGLAVYSRFPLREVAWFRPRAGWFPAWIVEIATPIGPLQLATVHLKPPLGEGGTLSASAYWSAESIHAAEMEEIWSSIDPRRPVIVAGDFNEEGGGGALRFLEERGLVNALGLFDSSRATWRWRTRYVSLSRRLDHVLYSPELDCASARVLEQGGSDHLPVLAVFERSSP